MQQRGSRKARRQAWSDVERRRGRGRHSRSWSSNQPSPWRRALKIVLGVVVLLALIAAGVTARVDTMGIPAPAYRLTASFPTAVPGTAPRLTMPVAGEAQVVTGGGVTLGSVGANVPQPIASLTKVMTALVVLTDHPLGPGQPGPTLTVSAAQAATLPTRVAEGQSLLPVTAGEHLSELQALQALLVPSADNVADILASWDAGSLTAFVAKMNATAKQLGMANTTYADASGYAGGSASTPADQIVLWRKAMTNPVFASIVADRSVVLPGVGKVPNYDTLVGTHGFVGGKTGSTGPAGGCLVWTAQRQVGGRPVTVFGVVLGQRKGPFIAAALASALTLTDGAYAELTPRTLVPAGTTVYRVTRAGQATTAATTSALTTVDPPGTPVRVTASPRQVTARSADATSTGSVTLTAPLARPTLGWKLRHIFG